MPVVSTKILKLRKCKDGYFRTSWTDETGERHQRSFGKNRNAALSDLSKFSVDWHSDPSVRCPSLRANNTLRAAWDRFYSHANAYYRKPDGAPTGEATNFHYALCPALDLFSGVEVRKFDVQMLKRVRDKMIADRVAVNTINARVRKIRHFFRWCAQEGIGTGEQWNSMRALMPLAPGRSVVIDGREVAPKVSDPVEPVPEAWIAAALQYLPATVAAMVQLQLFTGARPGEIFAMRAIDLETTGKVWLYRPARHKTEHHKHQRTIFIGPRAQEVIKPFLSADTQKRLFQPRDAFRQRCDMKAKAAKYGTWASYQARAAKRSGRGGDAFTKDTYGQAIERACEAADVPHWSPHRLRHNAATAIRKQFSIEVAQAVLGHARLSATQVYAKVDLERATMAMEAIG